VGSKLIERPRTKLLVAGAAALVLAVGATLRPRDAPRAAPPEQVAPILEDEIQRREPARVFRALQERGRRVLPYALAFRATPGQAEAPGAAGTEAAAEEPRGFGLAVSSGEVLTHRNALGPSGLATAYTPDGAAATASVAVYDPRTQLVLVSVPGLQLSVPAEATLPPALGELVLAAAAAGRRELLAPRFVESVEEGGCRLGPGALPPGTPVFNLQGEAIGLAGPEERPLVRHLTSARDHLSSLRKDGRALPSTLGLVLQAPDEAVSARLGAGLIVAGVVAGAPAEQAGLQPGDVLLSLDGHPLAGLEQALDRIGAVRPGHPVEVRWRRDGREMAVSVVPETTLADPRVPVAIEPPRESPTAAALFTRDDLFEAAVPPHARILTVEGRPVPASGLPKVLRRRGAPWLVHVHDGSRPYFAVVGRRPRP
jgi:S1-C subfamily serine protease